MVTKLMTLMIAFSILMALGFQANAQTFEDEIGDCVIAQGNCKPPTK